MNGKKTANIFYFASIIVLVSLNIYYGLSNKALKEKYSINLNNNQAEIALLREAIFNQVNKHNNVYINGLVPVSNLFGRGSHIKTYKLVYRFFNSECSRCTINDLSLIKATLTSNELKDVLFLPNIPETRENKILLQNLLQDFQFYPVPKSFMSLPSIDSIQERFFAIVDTSNMLQMIFFPNNELPDLTKQYLKICLNKISNKTTK